MLRIDRESEGQTTTIRLTGHLRSERLTELQDALRDCGSRIVFDLGELTLVDLGIVQFLSNCEAEGMEFLRCSPYIREWILRERSESQNLEPTATERRE